MDDKSKKWMIKVKTGWLKEEKDHGRKKKRKEVKKRGRKEGRIVATVLWWSVKYKRQQ